jgi:hypothetical protein
VPVLVTVHPARLFREPTLTPAATRDWQKVRWFLKGTWPRALPEPLSELHEWPLDVAFDTEYNPHTGVLHRYSVSDGVQAWVVEADAHRPPPYAPTHVWMHNAVADLGYLRALLMAEPAYDDTMLLHSVLASDMPHDLDYLGSLYAPYNRWKHLADVAPRLYAGGDALATWHIAQALAGQLAFDPGSERVYRESVLPLVPHILKAQQRGLRVNQPRVAEVLAQTRARCDTAVWDARAATGIGTFNVGSPSQVAEWLYEIDDV